MLHYASALFGAFLCLLLKFRFILLNGLFLPWQQPADLLEDIHPANSSRVFKDAFQFRYADRRRRRVGYGNAGNEYDPHTFTCEDRNHVHHNLLRRSVEPPACNLVAPLLCCNNTCNGIGKDKGDRCNNEWPNGHKEA